MENLHLRRNFFKISPTIALAFSVAVLYSRISVCLFVCLSLEHILPQLNCSNPFSVVVELAAALPADVVVADAATEMLSKLAHSYCYHVV